MNDSDRADDDLHELFRPHRETVATHATETDLAAARSRSATGQRRRVLGGTAAVALLAVGGGAIALSGGSTPTPDVVRSASIDATSPTDAAAAQAPDTVPATTIADEGAPGRDEASRDDVEAWLEDFPVPLLATDTELPADPGDLDTELDTFFETRRAALDQWADELSDWFDARPDGDISISSDDLLGDLASADPGGLGGFEFDVDDLGDIDLGDIDVTIGDDSIEIDTDGDGVADEILDLSELEAALDELRDFELGDFELGDLELGDFDIEWDGSGFPDLSELERPDGTEFPTRAEIDELLQYLEDDLGNFDIDDLDTEDFDIEDLDELFDSNRLDDLLGG